MRKLGATFWEAYSRCYPTVRKFAAYQAMIIEIIYILSSLRFTQEDLVLDAGCGDGGFCNPFSETYPAVKVVAIDSCQAMLDRGRERQKPGANIEWKRVSLDDDLIGMTVFNSFPGETFSAIVMVNSLYATENPEATVAELVRMLKPGGMLIIATPKKGASKMKILLDHLRVRGWGLGLREVWGMWPDLMKAAKMAKQIERVYGKGHFFTRKQMEAFGSGLVDVRISQIYADQDWLLVGTKPAA